VELRHLSYFATAAELGSINRAAAALHMTQPSLSRQIKELERDVGHALFERTSTGVTPTAAGTGLLRHLQVVFAQLERMPEVLRLAEEAREPVRIGLPQGMPHDWFRRIIEALHTSLPAASLSLHEATTEDQRPLLQNGLLDFGLLHFDAPELETVLLLEQRLGLAVPTGSPLAGRTSLALADFDGLTVMAHAFGEVNAEETRVRAAVAASGADTAWVFRRFGEHSELIAVTSEVDAVFMTEASAGRQLSDWVWIPVDALDTSGVPLVTRTWLAWTPPLRPFLERVVDVVTDASPLL